MSKGVNRQFIEEILMVNKHTRGVRHHQPGKANQRLNVISIHTSYNGQNKKKQMITSVAENVGKLKPSFIARQNAKGYNRFGKQARSFSEG